MRHLLDRFVITAGCGVLLAEIVILLATAYLGGGHPPASGIVVLLVFLIMGPVSVIAAIAGLSARQRHGAGGGPLLFVMTGVNLSFAVFAVMVIVLKVVLGRSI
jgi:hypothetical protein